MMTDIGNLEQLTRQQHEHVADELRQLRASKAETAARIRALVIEERRLRTLVNVYDRANGRDDEQ